MQFKEKQKGWRIGLVVGYVFSYALFTTILYGILFFLEKIPASWSYVHIMAITTLVAGMGFTVRRLLK